MEKLVLLSEVASLSVVLEAPSCKVDLDEFSAIASPRSADQVQNKKEIVWKSSSNEILGLLEEWDEPVKSKASKDVRAVNSCRSCLYFIF